MSNEIVIIGFFILIVAIFIYFIKNFKSFLDFFYRIRNKKIFIVIYVVVILLFLVVFMIYIYLKIIAIKKNINMYENSKINNEMFVIYDEMMEKENAFYENAINFDYQNQNSKIPYIPEGFEYLEGEWNNGYVIKDESGNEYVWVPCTNKEDDEILKLEKNNFENPAYISKDICVDEEYEEFIISALENGGFYISRYEIGNEDNKPVSKYGAEVWTDLTRSEAIEIIDTMYENVNCKLINGYAYDTTLSWIKNNNEITIDKIDISKDEKIYSGRNNYNNIYDFIDNIMEFTLETSYENVVIRGFSYKSANEKSSRYTIFENETFFDEVSLIGFRTIIYK